MTGRSVRRQRTRVLLSAALLSVLLAARGAGVEDDIRALAGSADEQDAARQDLLLAKEGAVGPLLEALDEPASAASRVGVVEVLFRLTTRIDDPRIADGLGRHLRQDPSAATRAAIARQMGLFECRQGIAALLEALGDGDARVRYEALVALGTLQEKLSQDQRERLEAAAAGLASDASAEVQLEASVLFPLCQDGSEGRNPPAGAVTLPPVGAAPG